MATDEAAQLAALRRNDEEAWRETYREQWPRAWSIARKYLRDLRDVEDVAGTALQQLHTRIANIENMAHLHAMVIVLAQRRAISLLREQSAQKRFGLEVASLEALSNSGDLAIPTADNHPLLPPDIGSPADAAQRRLDLDKQLARLDAEERDLLEAYFVEGRNSVELARETGQNPNTLRSRILRLLTRLRGPQPPPA